MRADTTRDSFQVRRHYRHVLQQQGRVSLDAEWNEQRSIDDHLRHRALTDLLGDSAGPLTGAAFEVTAAGAVVTIGHGRYYVGGVLLENDAAVALDAQPDLPAGSPLFLDTAGAALATPTAGTYLAELDSWTRHVTALDDAAIREIAVPVPDTTTRAQTVWQVRLVRVGAQGAGITCGTDIPAWNALRAPTTGRLRARSQPGDESATPCEVPAGAGYRGPDNQHYRVEIRDGGSTGTATFVWSRENSSVQAQWVGHSGNRLTVAVPSRDDVAGFAPDDWIELVDDRTELTGRPGTFVQIDTAHDDVIEVRPATRMPATAVIDLTQMGPNAKVRRWEGPPRATATGWLPLERGVEVGFEGLRTYRTGDFWSIPARTARHDILWPRSGGSPALVRPAGPHHRYTRLAVLEFDGTAWTVVEDCRPLFPPLTSLVTMRYAGGDGQHAPPAPANGAALVPLNERLRVAVANGSSPVAGARVRFEVDAGNGRIDAGAGPDTTVDAVTDAGGIASVAWSVDSATAQQRVKAQLLGSGGVLRDVVVTFGATLLRANGVTVDPSTCPTLAGSTDVQEALEALCAVTRSGCATVVVTPGDDWSAAIRTLPAGISARICFQPGQYPLSEPLQIEGLVDVSLDGAGLGSVIVAEESECALRFVRCESVTVRDLTIEARVVSAPGPDHPGQEGALTAVACGSVSVRDATLRCAGGKRRKGTACLSVFAGAARTRVVVRDSNLRVGHLQTGILVIDGEHVRITDNVIQVTRKGKGLSFADLLTDEARLRRLVGQLVAAPRLVRPGDFTGPGTGIRLGPWLTRFDSMVSREEWAGRIRAEPPSDDELASAETVRAYVRRLADAAVDDPTTFPAFEHRVAGLRRNIGATGFDRLLAEEAGRSTVRAMLIGTELDVVAVDPSGSRGRATEVRLGGGHVAFDSPVPAEVWLQALRLHGVRATDSTALRNALYDVSRRVLVDAAFRSQLPAFAAWFRGLVDRNRTVAAFGVVCAGRRAEDVEISGNRISGATEAIRVAVSHAAGVDDPALFAGTVRLRANQCELDLPMETETGQRGILVGNVRRLTATENVVAMPSAEAGSTPYTNAFELHGHLGNRVVIDDNVVTHGFTGINVVVLSDEKTRHVWTVRDNCVGSAMVPTDVPSSFIRLNNQPG